MKKQKTGRRIIASALIAVFLLMILMPASVLAGEETGETAPAEIVFEENAPVPAKEVPAEMNLPEGDAASAEIVPASSENRPAVAENMPSAAENVPAVSNPVPEAGTPAFAENQPSAAETAPAESKPAAEASAPAAAENAPSAAETAPAESKPASEAIAPAAAENTPAAAETAPAESKPAAEASAPAPAENVPAAAETAPAESTPAAEESGFVPAKPVLSDEQTAASTENRKEIQMGDYVFTVCGSFPEDTEIQAVEIPRDAAAMMAGKAPLFAYDLRLMADGQVWQPEDYGTDVRVSVRSLNGELDDVAVDLLHVKTNLIDEAGALSAQALQEALQNMKDGSVASEMIETSPEESGFSFDTSSFSGYVGTTESRIVYIYNAELFDKASADYAGVYATKPLTPNTATAEEAKTSQTIGIESIADGNLEDKPTTESPAIIQGAAVGYENRISPTEYTLIDPNRPRPEPYSEFTVKIMEEQGADGTVHKKPSGFDGTYVIVRLDVSEFFKPGSEGSDALYLHMEQKDNKALMPAATIAKGTPGATEADYKPDHVFTDGLGNRSASYKLSDLVDPNGTVPYVDVIVFATAANVAGADTASAVQGDIPLAFYVDKTKQYNNELTEYDPSSVSSSDPNASAAYDKSWHEKFFDAAKVAANTISHYLVKGSDLALETMVENSGEETTYWSLKKSMEKPYYDQEIDKDPSDPGSGITAKLMSEVAVTKGLAIEGAGADSLKKRTLDVNSFDIQVANDTGVEGGSAEDITLKNAWLTIADYSNTTGAELAIGNNARFVIDQGGKLIIDQTCQLEIEWDGATTAPGTGTQPDILNNGQLDLRAGGEIVNNGIITIEGTEGKPLQPETAQQANESVKGRGEMTIRKGATLTNNGALVVYGALTNYGRLVNNGRYNDVIKSNDPDKGAFNYHKGIQVSWKDDVTQMNIEAGSLTNQAGAVLINNGDIVLMPGILENKGLLLNQRGAHIYAAAATEAIIPITPDPATPTIVTKRITLDPVKLSYIINSGTLINYGVIAPATVALLDNTGGFDKLTSPGDHPELFSFINTGILHNYGYIYGMVSGNTAGKTYTGTDGTPVKGLVAALAGSFLTDNDLWLYLYEDGTFLMILPNGEKLYGTYEFKDDLLVFTFADGTVEEPELDENGNSVYRITTESGFSIEFVLPADFITEVRTTLEKLKA